MLGRFMAKACGFLISVAEFFGLDFWGQPDHVLRATLKDKKYVPAESFACQHGLSFDSERHFAPPLHFFIFDSAGASAEVTVSAEQYAKHHEGETIAVIFRKGRWNKRRRSYTGIT